MAQQTVAQGLQVLRAKYPWLNTEERPEPHSDLPGLSGREPALQIRFRVAVTYAVDASFNPVLAWQLYTAGGRWFATQQYEVRVGPAAHSPEALLPLIEMALPWQEIADTFVRVADTLTDHVQTEHVYLPEDGLWAMCFEYGEGARYMVTGTFLPDDASRAVRADKYLSVEGAKYDPEWSLRSFESRKAEAEKTARAPIYCLSLLPSGPEIYKVQSIVGEEMLLWRIQRLTLQMLRVPDAPLDRSTAGDMDFVDRPTRRRGADAGGAYSRPLWGYVGTAGSAEARADEDEDEEDHYVHRSGQQKRSHDGDFVMSDASGSEEEEEEEKEGDIMDMT